MTIKIAKLINELKSIGSIHHFISNSELIKKTIADNNEELIYVLMFVEAPYNHFNYYFLRDFEKKYRQKVILNQKYKSFFFLAVDSLLDCYKQNVYGTEKQAWSKNGKSPEATIEKALKMMSAEYLENIKNKGFPQLAELLLDFYTYFPFADDQEKFEDIFWPSYREYLEEEWEYAPYPKVQGNWNYGSTKP